MKEKDFIELFLKDNFIIENFVVVYESDFVVNLYDNDDILTIMAIPSYDNDSLIICTKINGKKHLDYKLVKDLQNKDVWSIIS